jgi:hypothetical protein
LPRGEVYLARIALSSGLRALEARQMSWEER